MPFCPQCRDEFEDWVKTCPDCQMALVEELPSAPSKSPRANEAVVLVATASNEPEGMMWAEVLENNGIHCLTKGGQSLSIMSPFSPFTPCEVYVPASCAQRAKEILESISDSTSPS